MVNDSGANAGRDVVQNATYAAGRDIHVHGRARLSSRHALPRDVDTFIGRVSEIMELEALLVPECSPSPVVVIANGPGCGKTALAVRLAHRLAETFTAAQLHVRLGGEGQPDLRPEDGLRRLLVQLGVEESEVPGHVDERAALYRSSLPVGSLVMLDDARSLEQVEPLLPAGPGCAAIITARRDLPGLEGIAVVDLGRLSDEDAYGLFLELVGAPRVEAEPEAARRIVELCGRLPLALRIAGALLNTRSKRGLPLGGFADRLQERRLDLLRLPHADVRAGFALSYGALSVPAARLFRLLGSVQVADVGRDFVLRLDGTPAAAEALDELIDTYLIEPTTGERVRFHDLMRVFAEECAAEEPAESRSEAMDRSCAWARDVIDSGHLDDEWAVIVELIKQTPDAGQAWRLALGLADFLEARGLWADWLDIAVIGERAARRSGDLAHGRSLHRLARVQRLLRRTGEAVETATRALEALVRPDAHRARALEELGILYREQHRYADALVVLGEAAEISRDAADEGRVLQAIGHVQLKRREFTAAVETLTRAARSLHDTGDALNEAWAHSNLVTAFDGLTEYERALGHAAKSLEIFQRIDFPQGAAWALNHAGRVHRALGVTAEQTDHHRRALEIFRELGTDRYGTAWASLDLGIATGDLELMREAEAIFREIGENAGLGWALTRMAEASRDPAPLGEALACFDLVGDAYGRRRAEELGEELGWNR